MRRRIIEGKIGILCATLCATLFLFQDPAYAQVRYDTFFVKPLPAGGLVAVSGQASVCLGTGLTVASGSITSNVATLVMSSNPLSSGFINGRDILVINFSGGAAFLNGSYTLTQVTSTQIQFAVTHGDVGSLGTGGVLMKPASNAACAPLANVFSDQGLTVSLNPFFSDDGKGNVGFWAVPGTYFLTYYSSGLNPIPVNQITIPCPASGCAFTGPTTAAKLNNVFRVDGVTYPFSTAGLQAAIAAAIAAGGGIVDARGMGSFNITSEIDVGNHAQVPVTLLLPQAATWTVSGITNGTSCAIKQFSQSSILGPGTGGSRMLD